MELTPPPTSLAAALALPRTPGRSAEVFVDGDLEVQIRRPAHRWAAGPAPARRTLFRRRGHGPIPGGGQGHRRWPRRPAVLRRACGAWVREYLGGLLRLGAVLRPGQAIALTPTPCSGFPRHNIPFVRQTNAYPRPMVGRGNAVGAGFTPPNAASRGGPTDRRSGDPRCGNRDGVSGYMARGCARAHSQTQPAPSMRPETPPPAQLGPRGIRPDRPPMPAHL